MIKALTTHATVAIAAVLFLAGSAHAQTGTTVQSATFSCTTRAGSGSFNALSWSVGASSTAQVSNGASGQEAKAGKAQLGTFNLVKTFDECSAALFGALLTGKITQTVTITDRGTDPTNGGMPKTAPVTIQLQDAQITQYLLSDSGSAAGPAESISLAYGRITITNLNNGSKFCWDSTRLTSC